MRNLHQILANMSKPKQLAEVAEPKPEDEKNFKDKHVIDKVDSAAGNDDDLYKGKVRKKDKSRPADYQDSEDVKVYENTEESGRGRYKVNYIHPDKKNIGNDRFESKAEAKKFADSLNKKGYHEVNITEELSERIQSKDVAIKEISSMISMNTSVVKDALDAAKLDPLAVLTALRGKKSIKPIQVSNIVQSHAFGGSIDKKDLEPVKKAADSAFKATVKEDTEDLDESHFEVGDEVKCLESGMTGKVIKLDKPEVGKYYTVKREDGKTMKYSGEELKSGKNIDEKSLSPEEEKKKEDIVKGMKKDKGSLKDKYGDDWKSVMYATATKRAQESMSESVEVSHERYEKEHGKKASGRTGAWMFTNKRTGNIDRGDDSEVFQPMNAVSKSFVDAAKEAKDWAKKHGHRKIYVMESVKELSEDDHMPEVRDLRKKGYSVYVSRPNTSTPERLYEIEYGDKELDIVKQADGSFTKKGSSKKYKSLKDAVKGEMKEDLGESKDVYYNSYTDAIKAAMETVKKRGFEVDEDEYFSKISTGQRKPSEGKTVTKSLSLQKNGKPVRKTLEIQVYNKGGSKPFELNHYIGESVEVQENAASDAYDKLPDHLKKHFDRNTGNKIDGQWVTKGGKRTWVPIKNQKRRTIDRTPKGYGPDESVEVQENWSREETEKASKKALKFALDNNGVGKAVEYQMPVIRKLEADGLVNKVTKSKSNRLEYTYNLTDKGKRAAKNIKEEVQENYPMTPYQEDSDVEDAYDLDREVLAAVISAAAFKLDWIDSVIEDEEVKLSVSLKDNVLSMKHLVDELFNRVRGMREAEPEVAEGVEVLESKINIQEEITDEDLDLLEEYISELSESNQKKAKELAKTEQGIKKLLDFVKKQEEDDE